MHLYCLYTQKSQITLFFASVIIFCVSTLFFVSLQQPKAGKDASRNNRRGRNDGGHRTTRRTKRSNDDDTGSICEASACLLCVLCCFDFQSSTPPHASQSLFYPSRCPQAWVEAKTGSWSPCHEPGPWPPTRSFRQRRQKEKLCCQQWGIRRPRCGSLHDRDILRRVIIYLALDTTACSNVVSLPNLGGPKREKSCLQMLPIFYV